MTMTAYDYLRFAADDPVVSSASFARREDAFFTSLRTAAGAWKTTAHHRLDALNDALFDVIARAGMPAPSVAMDVGISSGVTTLEWLRQFERRGMNVRMIGTDSVLTVFLVTLGRGLRVLVEPDGSMLQVAVGGRGIRPWCARRDYLNASFLARRLIAAAARRRMRALGIDFPLAGGRLSGKPALSGPHHLVTPELRGHANVILADDDILAPTPPQFLRVADVIRIANVLQSTNLSENQIVTAAANIGARCRGQGSLVAICRDVDGRIDGSVLRLTAGGFTVERRIGRGSEVERHFTGLAPTTAGMRRGPG